MGRAPDHVASCISGMYMGLDVFEAYDPARARALRRLLPLRPRQRSLPHLRHHQSAGRPLEERQPAEGRISRRRHRRQRRAGITVRGAKMLATGGIMANEVFVTCIQPLQPGDEKYAVSFAVPMNAKGLKILSRKSYEEEARSGFRQPAVEPLRRERRRACISTTSRCRGNGSSSSTASRCASEAVPCDAGARLPELPGAWCG